MNFKLCFVFLFIGFIFLNLSCVCADVEDNSTVVGDSFNEFENVDVIYDNFNELRDDISEGPFFYGDVNQVERSSNKVNTSLEVNDLVMYYKNGSKFNVVLKDSSDNVLVNKNVIINVNGVNYIRTTNNLGFASLNIRLLPGFYVVNVYFNGDSDFNPSTSISGVFVKSTIYSENLVKMFRNNTVFAALFFNNQGNPLKNQEITFIVNGVSYSKITNNQGVAGLGINLNPGNYTIITKNNFNQEVVQNNIEVKPLICENKDLVKYFKNDSQYVVKIIGKNGRVVGAGESVTFNINGIFYTKITNETGDVKLSIGLNPGEYIVTVEYLGCMVSNKITVLTILISNDLKMNYGDGSSFRVKILDNRGNPLNNTNVTFNINGVFYNRVTDNYGIARLGIRLTTGEYIVTSIYGDYSKGNNIIISNSGSTTYDSFGISHNRGFYNVSSLNVSIFCDELTVLKYSFDNVNWTEHVGSLNFSFSSGVWDLYYKFDSFSIYHVNYEIDNVGPIVWANYGSDLYDFPILVNLTAYDNVDENPSIFYTLNGSDPKIYGVRYNNPFTISSTTTLKFYTKDITNHKSDVVIVNYIFAHIGNLNTGKGFNSIQSAINDVDTVSGNVIKVKPGVYNENIVISKSIALVGDVNGSVILKGVNSNNPVIGITKNANNTLIYGLKIIDSNFGIVVLESNNVTLLSNSFNNVVESIICQNDSNTQIANNTIGFSNVVNGVTGIHIRSSKNLFVLNNTISLKSNSGSSCGIVSVFNDGCNMSIVNNKITNIYNGGFGITLQGFNIRIYKNNISNLRNGLAIDCSNSNISFNNLFDNEYGLYIHISRNNSYVSNNIYNNTKYGVYLDSSSISLNDKFYLNRLVNNGYFDFYSASSYVINISDNWWGEHYPKVSRNNYILANIFNGTGGVVLDSWIKISLYSASYEVLDGFLQRAKIYIDMNYNNLNKMVSNDEYLPDMWGGMSCFNNDGFAFEGLTKIVNGVGFVYFNLTSLFESFDNINVFGFMDNDNVSMILNKNVSININIFSSALDLSTFNFMNYVLDILMVDNTSWITVAWRQISLYCGFIDVIVNGCVVNSINISNAGYQAFKNQDFSPNFFEAMKMFNIFFASSKEGVFEPNYYLMDFIRENNLDSRSLNEIKDYILIYLKLNYGISSDECVFIKQYCSGFVDVIAVGVDYHGDISPNIELDVGGGLTKLNGLPSSFAVRQSNIYYDNIRDSDGFSVGYEGMRSFAIANDNVTNSDLSHWLSLNSTFPVGLMKASYGTFLTSLLVIYEHDRIADLSAGRFNVVWKRVAPVCVSLCNDYNCLYITGESDHGMGMEVCGNSTDVWNFRFACSFSFSLIEQLVGNNVWNDTTIGSVTLGLFKSYFDGESLEMIYSNGYVIFKQVGDNTTLLFLDSSTGIVRDVFSYPGILGTMPCYHDYITDNAVSYGGSVMNLSCDNHDVLENLSNVSANGPIFSFLGVIFVTPIEFTVGVGMAPLFFASLAILLIFAPDEANKMWEQFMYFVNPNLKDFHEIYKKVDNSTQKGDYRQIYMFNFGKDKNNIIVLRGTLFDTARYTFLSLFNNHQVNFYNDFKRSIGVLSGITIKDVEMYYKFSKPGKWEKGHVQNIGKPDITFNSLNGGGDNGSDIHGTFEGVGRSIKEKYDSLVFNIANKNFKSAIIDFNKLVLILHVPFYYLLDGFVSLLKEGYNFKEGVDKIIYK